MCECNIKRNPGTVSPLYFHTLGTKDVAMYAVITPKKSCTVPYWCRTFSAYNDSPVTGLISLKDQAFKSAIPIQAKHSLRLLADDLIAGKMKPLEYYGTVLQLNGRVVKFNPDLMTGQVRMMPKKDFLKSLGVPEDTTESNTESPAQTNVSQSKSPSGNTGIVPPGLIDKVESKAEQYPMISKGLLLMTFGIATIISSK